MFPYIKQSIDCFLLLLLLFQFVQPRRYAPKEGDNVMAWLHVICPGLGNIHFI